MFTANFVLYFQSYENTQCKGNCKTFISQGWLLAYLTGRYSKQNRISKYDCDDLHRAYLRM